MKTPVKHIMFLCAAILVATNALAANGDDIVGVWNSQGHDARIEIFKCGSKYCGKIVWMDEPRYTVKDKEGKPGELKLDVNNPDKTLRNHPILGLQIMRDFRFDGGNRWTDGRVYDPESGKTYRASMSLVSINELHLRGYIGIPLLGRTATWTRAKNANSE
jgi:uncharacterized protein (DUF2147 family)